MTAVCLAFAMFFTTVKESENDTKQQAPAAAVTKMNSVLAKKDFKAFYKTHCHKWLRDQISEDRFVEYMKSDAGQAITCLFVEVDKAIKQKKGNEILIARPQKKKNEYEFILVEAKESSSQKGRQWHLELKKEDGKWKLSDTD